MRPAVTLCLIGLLASGLSGALAGQSAPGLDDASAVPQLGERGREGYRSFLKAPGHRAFVIAPGGGWAWRADQPSASAAQVEALAECEESNVLTCVPYAVDDRVVFDAARWSTLWRPYKTAAEAARASEGVGRGQRFPDLLLADPAGKPVKLSSLRGKVTVLHFWGTWCPSCRRELPELQKLYERLRRDAHFAFVFTQVREPLDTARTWLRQANIRLPLHDSGAKGSADGAFQLADGRRIPDRAVAPVFPTTYILDRHGIVVFSYRGSVDDWQAYRPFLQDLAEAPAR